MVQKTTILQEDDDDQQQKSTQYYLTWRDMSTQTGILSTVDSETLWTAPAKEQYLPSYFKELCDQYLSLKNPRRVLPVECIGLQPNSEPPTWVIGSNLHVHLVEGVATRLQESLSPYAALAKELAPLFITNIKGEALDNGLALREIINIQNQYMGENFVPALLVLGGMGLALHYEQLVALYDGAPPILACGPSVSGKSLAVQIAMSLIGEETSIGECTLAGVLKLSCSRTLPFWWDDVSDLNMLETLTVRTFSQSQWQTAKKTYQPRSMPLMTMNPQCVYRSKRKREKQKETISRVFSRTAAIPFERISGVQKLEGSLELEASLQPLLNKAVLSVGTLIELREDFEKMCNDALFQEICPILEKSQLDLRSQMNYALLLFSTGKILQKLHMEYHFVAVKSHFAEKVVPTLHQILESDDKGVAMIYSTDEEEEGTMTSTSRAKRGRN